MTHDGMSGFLAQLASELRGSTRRGATLAALTFAAACGGEAKDKGTSSGGSPGTGGGCGTAQTGSAGEIGCGDPLQPYPTTPLGCFGPVYDAGYHGQCCYEARCYTPPTGKACDDPLDERARDLYSILPPGSGSCSCRENGQPAVSGPYAPNPTHTPSAPGTCCYLVGAIGCDGRPFFVEGELLLAGVIRRDDWGLAA